MLKSANMFRLANNTSALKSFNNTKSITLTLLHLLKIFAVYISKRYIKRVLFRSRVKLPAPLPLPQQLSMSQLLIKIKPLLLYPCNFR